MTQTAIEFRRWIGKLVLFVTLCWVVVLVSLISGAARGASMPLLNIPLALLPGCAFVPAAYFAVQLHRSTDAGQIGRLWPKTLVYGIAGLVLLFGDAYAIYAGSQP